MSAPSLLALALVVLLCQLQPISSIRPGLQGQSLKQPDHLQAMQWRLCDDQTRAITVSSVTLTPDPPVIGGPATFLVEGSISEGVAGGSVDIEVSFSGVQIYSQSEDLCAKTKCPVAPGPVAVTIVELLPPIAPPGDYGLRVTARGMAGEELMCLDVDFTLAPPS
eukprot:CAMPEP_0202866060 /NCGR_PEP_ID=MMETSP1391-20130828/7155_1 /ASSEMBLY_ACC=CAM_ASM_000867 /TAXON_ID=1034604 /ORGANISM="Chlamydomonas leiostraca, Strain SAG 11-49" /LENGTH=164 /DNA_ID=CAMNT_0049545973 /DNA_START=35 /DNA_END=529 /DNA_ORIENTATION=+